MEEEIKEVGRITHYYPKIGVAIVELKATLNMGDRILLRGITTSFEQTVETMQIQHKDIKSAEAGQMIGLKVRDRVREGDIIYK